MRPSQSDAAPGMVSVKIDRIDGSSRLQTEDRLAIEEPMEIRLVYWVGETQRENSVSITMRTPGNDFELAAGFLYGEGMVSQSDHIVSISHSGPPTGDLNLHNVVQVELSSKMTIDLQRLVRHFYTTSSCGVCGKSSLAALHMNKPSAKIPEVQIDVALLHTLPDKLRSAQSIFEGTGGLHGAALFDKSGMLLSLREDVGRHNAVDKLFGTELIANRLPLSEGRILLLSGRASFELIQKASLAGVTVVAAIGAPSSLAVELAQESGMTLVGFLRNGRCNIYCGKQRLIGEA